MRGRALRNFMSGGSFPVYDKGTIISVMSQLDCAL